MILRPATGGDVADVLALEREAFGVDAWSETAVREELTGPRRTAVVARAADGRLCGYAVTSVAGDVVDLQRVAVAPAHRRQGLARRLLREALPGGPTMLEVGAGNAAARALYAAEGFVEIAVRRRYYRDGSDAVVMRRDARP